MVQNPTALNWGIMGAGAISVKFVKDILLDPLSTRNVSDVTHKLVAVASRSTPKAQSFIDTHCGSFASTVKAVGSYDELVANTDVQVIYVGTPHSHHYENTKLCLEAGKHVLCEKPLTVNAAQAKALFALAKEKNVFLMEALWVRFFPLVYKIQEIIASGEIGEVHHVEAELSFDFEPDTQEPEHRMVDPHLAGGALLDLGPYPWTWLALTLLHQYTKPAGSPFDAASTSEPDAKKAKLSHDALPMPKILASVVPYSSPKAKDPTKVDISSCAIMEFPLPSGGVGQGVFVSSMRKGSKEEGAVNIMGSKGRIRVPSPSCRPEKFYLTSYPTPHDSAESQNSRKQDELHDYTIPVPMCGYGWEADEVARCVRVGKGESQRIEARETVLMMEVFDEIRKQGGIKYPSSVEKCD